MGLAVYAPGTKVAAASSNPKQWTPQNLASFCPRLDRCSNKPITTTPPLPFPVVLNHLKRCSRGQWQPAGRIRQAQNPQLGPIELTESPSGLALMQRHFRHRQGGSPGRLPQRPPPGQLKALQVHRWLQVCQHRWRR